MAKLSEVPVELQELEEEEGRLETLDFRQIRTLSGMCINCCTLHEDMKVTGKRKVYFF